MPGAAIARGAVDFVLPLDEIAPALVTLVDGRPSMSENQDREFDALLEYLQRTRGFDFTGYKRTSLMRRMRKRIEAVRSPASPSTSTTSRSTPTSSRRSSTPSSSTSPRSSATPRRGTTCASTVIPRILAGEAADEPIRVWSAGCASGEEAYTLAMLLAEALGLEAVPRAGEDLRHRRRRGGPDAGAPARPTRPRPSRAFRRSCSRSTSRGAAGRFVFNKELRRAVIFGRHDLVQDAPISRIDLLVCRNTLMYFNAETQTRILARFHFALKDDGILFLGKAEMLLTARATCSRRST